MHADGMTKADWVRLVTERVRADRDTGIELLAQLVSTQSVNPNYPGSDTSEYLGGETRANEVLAARFPEADLGVNWVDADPQRRALVGVRRGLGGGRSLILNGHIDTVPPANDGRWTHGDPWTPVIRDGYMYGLGACDMKSGLVAIWMAIRALSQLGVPLLGDLQLHSVPGEESGEPEIGTTACVEWGFCADGAIITEPTAPPRPLSITVTAAPWSWLNVAVEGQPADGASRALSLRPGGRGPTGSANAVEAALRLVTAIRELERHWLVSKAHPYFPHGHFSIMPGVFRSSSSRGPLSVPDRAEVDWMLYYPPNESEASIHEELEATIRQVAQLDPWLRDHPPQVTWQMAFPAMETPWEHPLAQAMAESWATVTGIRLPPPSPEFPANFTSSHDGIWLEQLGIPTVVFGPGDLSVAHATDEHVKLDEMIDAAVCLAVCIIEWCGVDGG
jgi:acetylornithine deacetylase/succinyl-diaminopimelate desuccinylase-like protein